VSGGARYPTSFPRKTMTVGREVENSKEKSSSHLEDMTEEDERLEEVIERGE